MELLDGGGGHGGERAEENPLEHNVRGKPRQGRTEPRGEKKQL